VGIALDTKGTEIRTGTIKLASLPEQTVAPTLEAGQSVTVTTDPAMSDQCGSRSNTLPDDSAPSARLVIPKALVAASDPGAPPEPSGGLLWPQEPASGGPKDEAAPLANCQVLQGEHLHGLRGPPEGARPAARLHQTCRLACLRHRLRCLHRLHQACEAAVAAAQRLPAPRRHALARRW
jgi:hypothetical protein